MSDVNVQAALADAYLAAAKERDELARELATTRAQLQSTHDRWQEALGRELDLKAAETQVLQVVIYKGGDQSWVGSAEDWAEHAERYSVEPDSIDDHFAFRGECVPASKLAWPKPECDCPGCGGCGNHCTPGCASGDGVPCEAQEAS